MAKFSPLMIAPPMIFAGFVLLAAVGMFREDPDSLPSAREGQPAPPVVMTEFPGKTGFDDATLRDGQVKLVNYWASWCAPCRAEHPSLEALSEQGIPVYGVNYKDSQNNASAFLEELGDPYAGIGRDEQGRMALDWGVYGVPETYVIAGDGTIVLRFAGPITQRVIDSTIRPALEKAAGN
ncbi:Thiol:disulfide interchange protein CycY precursor [Falsiruegeria litorea R37]|uniref:Thiol:disulfide interchange protein CycY n=2 Tax=Falsiruegeria TaxID=2854184 RepID=A0A1Y5SRU1_9RHOB|nr:MULTISPECIES: DsbE family thiol:disulfide interchange protein [Falsiruegeria]SLN45477.1 Thiol:disulfide interchange protein CycY precursor [Falsiruegeria litorea R37]SPJ29543.1 Thiol:disulfide interchange protein CycY [Falsiruegeria mediterranea M17]